MHHGKDPLNEEAQAFIAKQMAERVQEMQREANKLGLGPTGEFPEGKLVEHDEGEIQIGITRHQGKVIMNFGAPVSFLGFSPEQADEIIKALELHAQAIRRERQAGQGG